VDGYLPLLRTSFMDDPAQVSTTLQIKTIVQKVRRPRQANDNNKHDKYVQQ